MLAVFGALELEIKELRKRMQINRVCSYPDFSIREGKYGPREVLLVLTGVGQEKAKNALNGVLAQYPICLIMSIGFGGALNDKTNAGDIVVYSKLRRGESSKDRYTVEEDLECDAKLVTQAMSCLEGSEFRLIKGQGVTADDLCATPASKCSLGRQYQADIVDMESYWIGKIAAEKGLPFIAIRSVFDALRDDLSVLEQITLKRKIVAKEVLKQILLHPGQSIRLYHNYRKAAKNLALFVDALVKTI
jgi:adenosylhomocysteine nucleosidase